MTPLKIVALTMMVLACASQVAVAQEETGISAAGEVFAGRLDGENVKSAYGMLNVPLGQRYGLQLEGLGDRNAGDSTYGIAAHGYWRDPERGLFGLIVGTHRGIDLPEFDLLQQKVDLYGVEGEVYFDKVTLVGQLGRLHSGLTSLDNRTYAVAEVHWVPRTAWYLFGGARREGDAETYYSEAAYDVSGFGHPFTVFGGLTAGEFDLGYLGVEFLRIGTSKSGFSLFAEAQRGEGGYHGFLVGLRFGHGPIDNALTASIFTTATRGFR